MSGNAAPGGKRIAQNRKARRDYHLERPFEVGIRLTGTEVKSLRAGRANINDAYATERGGEVYLINAHIAQYDGADPSTTTRCARESCCCTSARYASWWVRCGAAG